VLGIQRLRLRHWRGARRSTRLRAGNPSPDTTLIIFLNPDLTYRQIFLDGRPLEPDANLGGDPILATQFLSRLREAMGAEMSMISFLDSPTVAGMAARISPSFNPMPVASPDPAILVIPRTEEHGVDLLAFLLGVRQHQTLAGCHRPSL
jgi:Phosphopantetheine attachment site